LKKQQKREAANKTLQLPSRAQRFFWDASSPYPVRRTLSCIRRAGPAQPAAATGHEAQSCDIAKPLIPLEILIDGVRLMFYQE